MDETGIEHQTKKEFVWTKRGTKIFGEKSGSARGRTSIIAGYRRNNKRDTNASKLIAPFYFNGHTTSEVFMTWLEEVLIPVWNINDILVMDNASWHKTKKVKDLLEKHNIKYIYQPPYSPDLNPIEHYWANMKRKIKSLESKVSDFYERLEMVLCKC
jgi:transposase